jgi:hypothetical protein
MYLTLHSSRLLSRLGSADCLESNASTFTVEMLEVCDSSTSARQYGQALSRTLTA